ncbi:MAG: FG-GAP-like repeat-containing protein [Polyangiaceae bacterium]
MSEYDVYQSCDGLSSDDASATSVHFNTGTKTESWNWNSLRTTENIGLVTGIMWHESMHGHDYHHRWDLCGWPSQSSYNGSWAAPQIVGGCMAEVLLRSQLYCNWSSSCSSGELEVIDGYSSTTCECVPDVYNSANENEAGDRFGASVTTGDFNGDSFEDLAVGTPDESGSIGVVYVFHGSPTGLHHRMRIAPQNVTVYDEESASFLTLGAEAGDKFGFAVAAGDFNGDGFDDLAIGTPGEKLSDPYCAAGACGYVVVLPGSSDGLIQSNGQGFGQKGLGANESGDQFGWSLAAGDFNADGEDDLAVGAPFEDYVGTDAGAVFVYSGIAGSGPALHYLAAQALIVQNLGGYYSEAGDEFGYALAAGNLFSSDTRDELAIGGPGEQWENTPDEGYVFVAEINAGGSWQLPFGARNWYNYGTTRFGEALAIGRLVASDEIADLAVGAPGESSNVGAAYILQGGSTSLSNRQRLHDGDAVAGDRFGAALAAGRFSSSTKDDLAVGIPGEAIGSATLQGAIWAYKGSTSNVTSWGYWQQNNFYAVGVNSYYGSGVQDAILPNEVIEVAQFGWALAAGNFNGDDGDELVVGAPQDQPSVVNSNSAGAVFVFNSGALTDAVKLNQVTMRYGNQFF